MRRHLSVGSIDLRIVETSLDHSGLGIVRHEQMRNATNRLEGADMGVVLSTITFFEGSASAAIEGRLAWVIWRPVPRRGAAVLGAV